MGRPKASEARDTRREILDAALELFADKGFHGTGLREIARAVGVRESALYHHFASKELLFEAILTESDVSPAPVREALDGPLPTDLRPMFERFFTAALERFATLRERKRYNVLMSDGLRLARDGKDSFIERVGGAARAEMGTLMQRLVAEGRLRGDPEMLGIELIAPAMMWRQIQALSPGHRFVTDYRTFARAHVDLFLRGAEAPAAPARKVSNRSRAAAPPTSRPGPPEDARHVDARSNRPAQRRP